LRSFERHLKSAFSAKWLDKNHKKQKFRQIGPARDHRAKNTAYNARMGSDLSTSLSATEKMALLNCRRLPARVDVAQAAVLLNFGEHDIRFLLSAGLLHALGKPAPNAPKYFSTIDILALAENREWLDKATKAISTHWREKNSRLKSDSGRAAILRNGRSRPAPARKAPAIYAAQEGR
jgi:hypothetical protein